MEELDRMLDNDHVALLSMKKDIGEAQKQEINKAVKKLLALQKENDKYRIANDIKERELADIKDSIVQLKGLQSVAGETAAVVQEEGGSIKSELAKVNTDVEAEHRTNKMLTLMSKRLQEEIATAKIDTSKTQFELDGVRHELDACESSLRLSRQELAEQERQLESLTRIVRSRREERMKKMKHLKNIVNDGEASVAMVKQAAASTLGGGAESNEKSVGFSLTVESGTNAFAQGHGGNTPKSARAGSNNAVSNRSPQTNNREGRERVGSPMAGDRGGGALNLQALMDEMEADTSNPLTSTFKTFNFANNGTGTTADGGDISIVAGNEVLTFENIKSIIERYRSRQARLEKMQQFNSELKAEIIRQNVLHKELTERLEASAASQEILSSSRQVYQEVDMKDTALASARKECEECRRKEYRLRVNIESLKRGLPRFLTKVTKVVHPIPTVEQLPDAVHKLEDEIAKLIKYIGTAIVKDATPEDLALLTANGSTNGAGAGGAAKGDNKGDGKEAAHSDVNSEIGRIRKLPGYQRLQRQLFINLMSAKQDMTERNVRIYSSIKAASAEATDMQRPDTVHSSSSGNNNSGDHSSSRDSINVGGSGGGGDSGEGGKSASGLKRHSDIPTYLDSLDRTTVKSISSLILEKNNAKIPPAGVGAAGAGKGASSNALRRQQQFK